MKKKHMWIITVSTFRNNTLAEKEVLPNIFATKKEALAEAKLQAEFDRQKQKLPTESLMLHKAETDEAYYELISKCQFIMMIDDIIYRTTYKLQKLTIKEIANTEY